MQEYASKFKSTANKAKLAAVGSMALLFSYIFLFYEGPGSNFVALAWPGMVLCAPFGYDVLVYLLNKEQ